MGARIVAYIPLYLHTRAIFEIPSQFLAVASQGSNFSHILLSKKVQIKVLDNL